MINDVLDFMKICYGLYIVLIILNLLIYLILLKFYKVDIIRIFIL